MRVEMAVAHKVAANNARHVLKTSAHSLLRTLFRCQTVGSPAIHVRHAEKRRINRASATTRLLANATQINPASATSDNNNRASAATIKTANVEMIKTASATTMDATVVMIADHSSVQTARIRVSAVTKDRVRNNVAHKTVRLLATSNRASKMLPMKCVVVFRAFWRFPALKNRIISANRSLVLTSARQSRSQKSPAVETRVAAMAAVVVVAVATAEVGNC